MFITYKLSVKDTNYENEIGVFKFAWWSDVKESIIIGVKGMDDILLPMPLTEANLFISKLFEIMKHNEYVKISGLCFSDTDDTEALGREKDSDEFNLEKFKKAIAEKRRYVPEKYDIEV